ncbi:MAG: CapA family protein [Symbiobacteriaceae bacterium]|nr:CapA family protein [Symbiobacteriaceae bacterium]
MKVETSVIATGDALITRTLPSGGYPGFPEIQKIISRYDVRFSNLETTVHRQEGYPAAFSGGTWTMADPAILDDLKGQFGFNLYNTANNHSLDYEIAGLLATIRHLEERNMPFAGTGRNLGEAGAPTYLEAPQARVAMIGVSASFYPSWIAGNSRIDMVGRPGLNPLRSTTSYYLAEEQFGQVKALAEKFALRPGASRPGSENQVRFAGTVFHLGTENMVKSEPHKKDMERILGNIKDARRQADYVLVSLHAHAPERGDNSEPASYLKTFARACIDAGAIAVLGHGPHVMRPIELYNGGVIFYSLGNFIFQPDTESHQPADAFENASLHPHALVGEYMDHRAGDGSRSAFTNQEVWRAVMAGFNLVDGKITQVQLYPITLGMELPRSRIGWPSLLGDNAALEYMAELCNRYGTKVRIENAVAYIDL